MRPLWPLRGVLWRSQPMGAEKWRRVKRMHEVHHGSQPKLLSFTPDRCCCRWNDLHVKPETCTAGLHAALLWSPESDGYWLNNKQRVSIGGGDKLPQVGVVSGGSLFMFHSGKKWVSQATLTIWWDVWCLVYRKSLLTEPNSSFHNEGFIYNGAPPPTPSYPTAPPAAFH